MIRFGIYKDRVFVFHAYKRIHLNLNLLYIRIFLRMSDIHGIPSQILVCRLLLVKKKRWQDEPVKLTRLYWYRDICQSWSSFYFRSSVTDVEPSPASGAVNFFVFRIVDSLLRSFPPNLYRFSTSIHDSVALSAKTKTILMSGDMAFDIVQHTSSNFWFPI